MIEEAEDPIITVNLDIDTIRLLHWAVNHCHEKWCGSEPYDQTDLKNVKTNLYACLLDARYITDQL